MISLLAAILCAIKNGFLSVVALIVMAFNGVVAALGALVELLLLALPPFPDPPAMPGALTDVLGWIAWVFPVGTVISILAWAAAAWLTWQGVALVLRWAKGLPS